MPSLRSRLIRLVWRWRTRRLEGERSIERMRADLDALGDRLRVPPLVTVEQTTVAGRYAEWLVPAAPEARLMLYLHGGAYCVGSCASHRGLVGYIAQASEAVTLLPEYRLAPEHPHPAAVEDAMAAYQFLLSEGVSPEQIVLAGDSAGGGLVLATLIRLRNRGEALPAAAVLLSPWTDLTGTGESMQTCAEKDPWLDPERVAPTAALYCGERDPCHPLISPLYADLHDLPPLLIQVGDHEILLSDATRLAEKAEAAGVDVTLEVWEGMWHVWHAMVSIVPESRRAIERIGAFVQEQTAHTQPRRSNVIPL